MIRSALRHPLLSSAAAAAASIAAILAIGLIAHLPTVVRAIDHLHPSWLGVALAAEILSLPSYALAYRTIVRRYSHESLTARVTLHMVLAGFGLFAVLGGFSVDRLGLQRLGADPKGARQSVLALGLVEIVTLAIAGFARADAVAAGVVWHRHDRSQAVEAADARVAGLSHAILVNTSRGPIVDEGALVDALRRHVIS